MKRKLIVGALGVASSLFLSGAACAAEVYNVQVWTVGPIASANNLADPAHMPGAAPTATFTWTGDINWSDTSAQNSTSAGGIASNFLDGFATQASNFSSATMTQAAFLASSLTIQGDAYTTFFHISGNYFSPNTINGTFSHDDGATVFVDGVFAGGSAGETSVVSTPYTLAAGSHAVDLYYVAGNGTPSVLNFSTPAGVPEPTSWALMILGFGGVGAVVRRRRAEPRIAAA
jgi:hypothetical protein